MHSLRALTQKIIEFRDARDWKQFHAPKDLAISLALEAAEVLEHFQWKSEEAVKKYIQEHKDDIAEELADVLIYLLVLAHELDVDLIKSAEKKILKNELKYPVSKAKGKATKYDKL